METTKTAVVLQINENASASELKEQALLKFGKAKVVLSEMQLKLATVIIKDEASLAIANDVLAEAKEMEKKVEAKRVLLKAPALEYGKAIDAAAKDMRVIIEEPIKRVETKKLEWLKKLELLRQEEYAKVEQERALAEAQKNAEIEKVRLLQAKIASYGKEAIQELGEAMTNDQLKEIYAKFITNAPKTEYWGPMANEANATLNFIRNAGKIKKNIINYEWQLSQTADSGQIESIKTLLTVEKGSFYDMAKTYNVNVQEQIAAAEEVVMDAVIVAEEKKAEILEKSLDLQKQTTGLRKTWVFEIDNEDDIPKEWRTITVNTKVVNEWLKQNNNTLNPNGEVHKGLKFFLKQGLSGR